MKIVINGVEIKGSFGESTSEPEIKVIVDGVQIWKDKAPAVISLEGTCKSIYTDSGTVSVSNGCESIETSSGSVCVYGSVNGDVETMSGSVRSRYIKGSVRTVSGSITSGK